MAAFVYMLRCCDGSYYVGSTRTLEKRIWEHQQGLGAEYTRRRLPVELVWSAEFPNVGDAFFWEKRIQNWSRAKREALIGYRYDHLPDLAKKQFPREAIRGRSGPAVAAVDHLARLKAMTRPPEVVAVTDEFLAHIEASRPGLIHGLYLRGSLCWGEFFHDSDIDFVAVLSRPPGAADLAALEATHAHLRRFSPRRYEGFYCQPGDLAAPPTNLGSVPVHHNGSFEVAGRTDVNLVTWHELAERGAVVRGVRPTIHTDLDALLDLTRANLSSYWTPLLARIEAAGDRRAGADQAGVTWATLGVARLHHLLATGRLTSKSGAGRYILSALDPRWHALAREALAIRELPDAVTSYDDPSARGRDLREFVAWTIDDGLRR